MTESQSGRQWFYTHFIDEWREQTIEVILLSYKPKDTYCTSKQCFSNLIPPYPEYSSRNA